MQVYDAIVRSKLLYGLECIQLTPVEQSKLDAFQMSGLRRILKIPPTHIDRTWTNERVYTKAREEAGKDIMRFTDMWMKQKLKLLGHLLRATPEDPLHQVVFRDSTKIPRMITRRRAGSVD